MGMIDRMEREKRNKERRKHAKGERVEVDWRRGNGVADSNVASDGWVHGDGCAGGREGRNAFLILKNKIEEG